MREAVSFVRTGDGAAIVHADCVRIHSHSNSDRHELYRSPEEIAAARALDPLPRLRRLLIEGGAFTEEEIAEVEARNQRAYEEAVDRAKKAPDPVPGSVFDFVTPEPWVPRETASRRSPSRPPRPTPRRCRSCRRSTRR